MSVNDNIQLLRDLNQRLKFKSRKDNFIGSAEHKALTHRIFRLKQVQK